MLPVTLVTAVLIKRRSPPVATLDFRWGDYLDFGLIQRILAQRRAQRTRPPRPRGRYRRSNPLSYERGAPVLVQIGARGAEDGNVAVATLARSSWYETLCASGGEGQFFFGDALGDPLSGPSYRKIVTADPLFFNRVRAARARTLVLSLRTPRLPIRCAFSRSIL